MDEKQEKGLDLTKVLADSNLPSYYANSFVIGNTPTDVFLLALKNGGPEFLLNMSFSSAKELSEILAARIKFVEEKLGHTISTVIIK